MCICLKKVSRCDWVSARHTSACITGLYVDFNLTRTDTATMTDYRQLQKTTASDQEREREREKVPEQQNRIIFHLQHRSRPAGAMRAPFS